METAPIELSVLVDEEIPMDEGPEAFRGLADGTKDASKVLVRFDGAAG